MIFILYTSNHFCSHFNLFFSKYMEQAQNRSLILLIIFKFILCYTAIVSSLEDKCRPGPCLITSSQCLSTISLSNHPHHTDKYLYSESLSKPIPNLENLNSQIQVKTYVYSEVFLGFLICISNSNHISQLLQNSFIICTEILRAHW